jgi:transcriptional regulator with XRE-family HTH domain
MATFSENVKILRRELGLTQEAFAVKINVHRVTMAKYEKGILNPSFEILENISATYKANIGWLVSGAGPMMATTTAGGMRCGEALGTYSLPVDDELMEIAKYLRRNEAVRKLVLAMVRGAEKPKK